MGVFVIVLFGLLCYSGTCLTTTIPIPSTADAVNGMNEYILYTHSQSWNTAKRVCAGIGGQLANIDSPTLLDQIQSEAGGSWSSGWYHTWTGLHRATDETLIQQDCTPFDFGTLGIGMFKTPNHHEFKADRLCMRVQKDEFTLERYDCSKKLVFLCERKSGTCQYNSVNTSAALVSQFNATSGSCRSVCDTVSGCFLAGNYLNSHCVLLKAPAGGNSMSLKACYSASTNTTNTDTYKDSDDTSKIPTTCAEPTTGDSNTGGDSSVGVLEVECPSSNINVYTSTEVICSTEVVTLTPSVNDVTVVVTSAVTDTVTEWLTETQVVSLTEISTAVLTSAEILTTTETTVEVVSSCAVSFTPDSSCVTEITSTNVFTTMTDCPSVIPEYLTLTSSCPEQSVEISPTTVTLFESTSCFCEMTSSPPGVISPESVSTPSLPTLASNEPSPTTLCTVYHATEIGDEAIAAIVSSIYKTLTVETKNLSSSLRKKSSATDPRMSSMGIGYGAVALIVVPFSLIVLADIPGIFSDCRNYLLNIKQKGYP